MHPWSCDDIVTCDNFEYMVRPSAEALLFLAVTADAVFIAKSSPPTDTPAPADPVLFPRAPQETATFATTGGHVWPAARRLVEYFEAVADDIGLSRPGAQIVELGAGTGWLSMALAKNLPNAKRVVATEMGAGGALRWLRRNVRANEQTGSVRACMRVLTTEECDWSTYLGGEPTRSGYGDDVAPATSSPDVETEKAETAETETDVETRSTASASTSTSSTLDSTAWDFVLGSDLVYDDAGVAMLPRVFRRLLDNAAKARERGEKRKRPVAYYAHTKYRYELRDIEFFAEMSRRGLVVTEVREPNAPTPPASPEPLSQLFPEKRIAVFQIRRREDVAEPGEKETHASNAP